MDRSALGDMVHRRKRCVLAYARLSGCHEIKVVRRLQIKRRASVSRLVGAGTTQTALMTMDVESSRARTYRFLAYEPAASHNAAGSSLIARQFRSASRSSKDATFYTLAKACVHSARFSAFSVGRAPSKNVLDTREHPSCVGLGQNLLQIRQQQAMRLARWRVLLQ